MGSLTDHFVAENGPGSRHVEGPHGAPHRYRHKDIASPGDERTQPFILAPQNQAEGPAQIG